MAHFVLRARAIASLVAGAAVLAGCTAPSVPPPTASKPVLEPCVAAAAGEPLAGNWLSVRTQKGVLGELRTLFTLHADGTMAYTEQLKRPKKPSQGLDETGCWKRDGQVLVIETRHSNGVPVDASDPIYTNRYTVVSSNARLLTLQGQDGVIKAKRMSPGYRLPF